MSDSDKILLEDMNHKFTAIMEILVTLAGTPVMLAQMNDRLINLEIQAKAMRAAITDQTGQLNNHEVRITKLEHARA